MTYSVDLREKVVAFVQHGGSQTEATRCFDLSLWCVRDWLARPDLQSREALFLRNRVESTECANFPANP